MTEELWTLEQLPNRVAELLSDNYDGQTNGRVRELPNGRTIRWYTTIGLVDRPVDTRGRTALYGARHLLQLAAVKRLQAAGHTLAEIQERLLGATNEQLADLAQVPRMDVAWPSRPARAEGFWRTVAHTDGVTSADSVTAKITDSETNIAVSPIHGLRLGDSVTVVLNAATRSPDAAELAAIEAAAAPLLDLLDRMGLAPSAGKERR
jgi:DNA-binding transcriptional MerR regulator